MTQQKERICLSHIRLKSQAFKFLLELPWLIKDLNDPVFPSVIKLANQGLTIIFVGKTMIDSRRAPLF